jgi:hypothetical protein
MSAIIPAYNNSGAPFSRAPHLHQFHNADNEEIFMSPYVPFVVLWAALALAVIGLIVYRKIVAAARMT